MRKKVIENNWSFIVICITLCALFLVGISPVGALTPSYPLLDRGETVLLGETSLDLTSVMAGYQYVAYKPTMTSQPIVKEILNSADFDLAEPVFNSSILGSWYLTNDPDGATLGPLAFVLAQPKMTIQVVDASGGVAPCNGVDRSGSTVMYPLPLQFRVTLSPEISARTNGITYDINFSDVNHLPYSEAGTPLKISDIALGMSPNLVTPAWATGKLDGNGQYRTPPATYSFTATCMINGLAVTSPVNTVTLAEPSVSVTVSPSIIQRGNQALVNITGQPNTDYYFGIIECPLRMTGKVCDRPPWIITDNPDFPITAMTGAETLVPSCCDGLPFSSVVPTTEFLDDGHARYGKVTTDCNGVARLMIASDANTWKAIGDPSYTLHVQKTEPEDDGTTLYDQTTLMLTKGTVSIQFYLASDPDQTPITEAFLGDRIGIKGTNTETGNTFLYMTGPCQPACGGSLTPHPYDHGLLGPGPDRVNVIGGSWSFVPEGTTFNYWDTSVLPINPGNYTIYALSSWPDPTTCPGNNANCQRVSCGGGTCQLLDCPNCIVYALGTINLKKPTLDAHINDIERCCCPGTACGTTLDMQNITVVGNSTGYLLYKDPLTLAKTKELNVWVFGKGKVGPEKFLNWHQTNIPCDGAFSFPLNLTDHNNQAIPLCSLDAGTYDVIIQTLGYNKRYDVLREEDTYGEAKSEAPMELNKRWIVTSYPTNAINTINKPYNDRPDYLTYSRLVQVEGPGYKMGAEALNGLIKGLENPDIDDQYVHIQFTIKNRDCLTGTDFDADRTYGNMPLTVRFTDKSGGSPGSWAWDFGDGNTSTEQNPIHTYTSEGRFTVTLVTDGNAKNKAVKNEFIRVAKGPMAAFSTMPEDIIAGSQVQFIDLSTGNPSSWFWEFGDGGTSPLQSPVYIYARPGSYTVQLTVSDGNGISQTASKVVTVSGSQTPIEANFDTRMKGPATVEFTDLSTGYGINSWVWNFGDGSASSEQNPTHIYQKEGTFDVTLTVSNGYYEGTLTKTIGIR